jgi:hypothetical protein
VGTWRWPRTSRPAREPVLEMVEPVSPATLRRIKQALADWPHR